MVLARVGVGGALLRLLCPLACAQGTSRPLILAHARAQDGYQGNPCE